MQFPGHTGRRRPGASVCRSNLQPLRQLQVVVAKPRHSLIAEFAQGEPKLAAATISTGARDSASSAAELRVSLTKPDQPIRNHIQPDDVKHWSKRWKVTPGQVLGAIEKVGNSVKAVQKELTLQGLIDS